jgi:hypothetical protein
MGVRTVDNAVRCGGFRSNIMSRRRFQFTLRKLLAVIAIICFCCFCMGVAIARARRQQLVVCDLRASGILLWYAHEECRMSTSPKPAEVHWSVFAAKEAAKMRGFREPESVFDHLFESVHGVRIIGNRSIGFRVPSDGVREAEWVNLVSQLASVRELFLMGDGISNESIRTLCHLKHLETLYVYNCSLTDAAAEDITRIQTLRCLCLYESEVTSEAVCKLRRALPNCTIKHSPRTFHPESNTRRGWKRIDKRNEQPR